MSELKAEFEFEVGEIVFAKFADHDDNYTPKNIQIFERIIQQCHGGVQTFYQTSSGKFPSIALVRERPEVAEGTLKRRLQQRREKEHEE